MNSSITFFAALQLFCSELEIEEELKKSCKSIEQNVEKKTFCCIIKEKIFILIVSEYRNS